MSLVEGPLAGARAVRSWPNLCLTFGSGAPDSTAPWRRALARFRRAEAALAAAAREPDEDLYDALNGAFYDALRRLLRTPAPDLPTLAAKLTLTVDHEAWELTGAEAFLATLKRDAIRLCLS